MARTARFSLQLSEEVDLMNESQMISWIAQAEDIRIDITKQIQRKRKD
jgi:hypothetical protein